MSLSRRPVLEGIAGVALLGCADAGALPVTPGQGEGPYYPLERGGESDADLTTLAGRSDRASGQVIHVQARLLDARGAPISGAHLELWQANALGRYWHPADRNPAPLDPSFQGFATLTTDPAGRFSIVSILPGAYPDDDEDGQWRTPHIHWKVSAGTRQLTTQMYFPGEPRNETDWVMARVADPRPLISREVSASEPGVRAFEWEIVLPAV